MHQFFSLLQSLMLLNALTIEKINDNSLNDQLCLTELRYTIQTFVYVHTNNQTPLPLQWEALKCVLRRVLIQPDIRERRKRRSTDSLPKNATSRLPTKDPIPTNIYADLFKARHILWSLLDLSYTRHCNKIRSFLLNCQ